MKKISIIIPIYNRENTLRRTIDSVLCQRDVFIELILVNDGSTDKSEVICREYCDSDKRIIYRKIKNGGPSKARNVGLELATGEYITFIDSDDFYEEYALINMINEIKDNDILICNRNVYNNKNIIKKNIIEKNFCNIKQKWECVEYLQSLNLFNPLWNKLYRRDVIYDNNIRFNENLISGEDYLFNLQYFERINKGAVTNTCVYNYYVNFNSITGTNKNNDFFKQIIPVEYQMKLYLSIGRDIKKIKKKYFVCFRNAIAYKITETGNFKNAKKYIEKCLEYLYTNEKKLENYKEISFYQICYRLKMYFIIYLYVKIRINVKKIFYKMKGKVYK